MEERTDLGYQQALRYAEELRELYETERGRTAELEAAQGQLKEAAAKYRTLVERLPAIVYRADFGEAGAWGYVSPQIESILGFTPEEWMTDPELWYRQLHPEDKVQAIAEERLARDTGEPLLSEYRMLSRDGRVVWFRDEAVVVPDEEGEGRSLQGVMYDITDRKDAEEALRRRERILEAVSFTAEEFLKGGAWQENIQEVLARLGQASDASRTYICQNHRADDGALLQSMRHEWVAPGISPQIDNPAEQSAPYADGFSRWEETLGQDRIIQGHVREFPASEQTDLTKEEIRSMAVVPIFVRGDWWGYTGFDECLGEREWSYAELGALKAAADTLGAAIQRQAAEHALQRYTERLESLREIDLAILAAESVEDLILAALSRLQDLVPSRRATVWLMDFEAGTATVFVTSTSPGASLAPGVQYPIERWGSFGDSVVQKLRGGHVDLRHDLATEPDLSPGLQALRDEGIRSLLVAPLLEQGELMGVVGLYADAPRAFTPEQVEIAGEVANQLAIAIRHARLRQELEEELAERKRAEEETRRSEARKSAILESAMDCVITMDHEGKVVEFNPAAEKTFGYDRNEVVGKEMAELIIPPSLRKAHREGLARYLATGEGPVLEKRLELTGMRSDGTEFPVELAITRVDLPGSPLFTGYLRDITQRVQADRELRETDEQRRSLLSHLTMAQEEERSRIAGDIHDDTIQVMTAVAMRLDILRRDLQVPEQIALLEQLEETVTVATVRLRNLLFELHPPTLDRDGLAAALRVYLEQNLEQTGLAYTLEDRLTGEPPAETRVILYRIAQEALANVRRHARASSVTIVLEGREGGFLVRIADDGAGFSVSEDARHRPGHLGLASMRERAEMAGGWSRIDSAPGAGTSVEFWLPDGQASDRGADQ